MESTYGKIILSLCLFVFLSCKNDQSIKKNDVFDEDIQFNFELQSGDLVFRYGDGYFSEKFRKYASVKEHIYSHGGIVFLENEKPMVYHAEASEQTGVGFVKKETLDIFLKNISIYGFYRISCQDSIKQKIVSRADYYFQKNTPFDLSFDISNDDKVYCSELVANAINYAFGEAVIIPNIEVGGKMIYGVDNLYLNEGFHLIYKTEN